MDNELLKLSERVTKLECINEQVTVDLFFLVIFVIAFVFVYFMFFNKGDKK